MSQDIDAENSGVESNASDIKSTKAESRFILDRNSLNDKNEE